MRFFLAHTQTRPHCGEHSKTSKIANLLCKRISWVKFTIFCPLWNMVVCFQLDFPFGEMQPIFAHTQNSEKTFFKLFMNDVRWISMTVSFAHNNNVHKWIEITENSPWISSHAFKFNLRNKIQKAKCLRFPFDYFFHFHSLVFILFSFLFLESLVNIDFFSKRLPFTILEVRLSASCFESFKAWI